MTAKRLIIENEILHREKIHEKLSGVIFYADMDDKSIEIHNLMLLRDNLVPCWPDPRILLLMADRHKVLEKCVEYGFVNHRIVQGKFEDKPRLDFPFVLKTGTQHRGEGKYLIKSESDIPEWEGIASLEPFFEGDSIRVLIIGKNLFCIKLKNDKSWIKNSAGSDFDFIEKLPDALIDHALSVAYKFKLEIAGVDYILDKDKFYFLEINQFPGIGASDEIIDTARRFLNQKMDYVENLVAERSSHE
jgi:hypothetical protein